ncbi:MAG: DMT family transporter [Candidatus Calescibacterium sp.]|nr:DMT family transporter [Candidatus Calescibacterium sp.]MCX7972829.1 DMT family transporter [bacterium]MDW8195249.1 DMT family transporter [Candidatus Calescibacterium sp.]
MGTVFILIAIFLVSVEPIIVKSAYNSQNINPFSIILFKNLIGGLIIIPLITILGNKLKILKLSQIFDISRASVLLLFTTSMMIISLKFIPAVVMLTIFTSTPAFVSLINSIKGKEKTDWIFWIGFSMAFIGITLLLDIYSKKFSIDSNFFFGVLFAFLGVLSSSLYRTNLDDLTNRYTPIVVSTYIFLLNSIIVGICYIFFSRWIEIESISMMIGIYGGVAGALANVSFLYALSILGSTKVSILNMLQQPTIIILSSIILKEYLSIQQIIGIVLVLLGINLAIKRIIKV